MSLSQKFPTGWPQDAVDAEGGVFRLVKSDPPTDADLASHHETGRLPKAPPCLRCGISVFREMEDAVHQRQLFPKLGDLIATATLQPVHGRTKLTEGRQPTHTTWWAYEGVQRASLFSVVKEER